MIFASSNTKDIHTTCPYCGVGCGMRVSNENGVPRIQPDESHPANYGKICSKGANLGETIDLEGRALHPLLHGRQAGWDEALDTVARGFSRAIDRHGPDAVAFYVSGQLLTEDYYVANKLMKGFIGCANIDTNSRLCMSSAVAGHQRAFGEDLVPGSYEDLEQADLVVIAGGNSAWCHPVLFQRLQAAREQRPHMQVVVIDPRRTVTADLADLHLPLRPGTDVDLFNGLFRHLAEQGRADHAFIRDRTADYAAARDACRGHTLDTVAARCDLELEKVARFYHLFAERPRTLTLFSQGINQSSAGTDKVNAILNCHLLTGRIGKPGRGPFSLTGQPNAMGGREVGGLASTLAAHMGFEPDHVERTGRFWDSPGMATKPGLKAVDLFKAMEAGDIKAIWIMGTNPAVSMPDGEQVRRALNACDLVVVSDCMAATDTTRHAQVLLPAAAWGEKDGTVTNSERRISRQRAFLAAPGDARPDWWMICQVARRMGYEAAFSYDSPAQIFSEHARLSAFENTGERRFNIGALGELTAQQYDGLAPVQWPVTAARPQGTARLDLAALPGRMNFLPVEARPPASRPNETFPLVLNTGRVRDHWHTLTRTGKSARLNRVQNEPFVAVHPDDAGARGLLEHYLAELESAHGKFQARVMHDSGQRRGEVFAPMHWNDSFSNRARADALVAAHVDPISGEPEFKYTPVRIRSLPMGWFGFLLSRREPGGDALHGLDYWTRMRGDDHWRLEMAGRECHSHWGPWARRILGAVKSDADWLEFADSRAGCYRLASLDPDGRLEACLMLAPAPGLLPERTWLGRLFSKKVLDGKDRAALLAGGKPGNGQFSRARQAG